MCTNFKEGQCQFCSQIKNDSNSVWYNIISDFLRRVLVAVEGQHSLYCKIQIRAGISIGDVGQPYILVPLLKRTTSFSYFYGSEWKMVIYEYQMPKTSCFSFPNTAQYTIIIISACSQEGDVFSIFKPIIVILFFLHVIIVIMDFQNSVVPKILLKDFSHGT